MSTAPPAHPHHGHHGGLGRLHAWTARVLPGLHRHARARMFGLAERPEHYQRSAARIAEPLYRRAAADVAAAGLPDGARVLDLGTGPGLLPTRIAAAAPGLRIDAVDLAPEMIEQARRNAEAAGVGDRVTFTVADVARLPFPDGQIDLVVSTISQHHWEDPAAALREISRVLRPGGQAWIYDVRWSLRRARRAALAAFPERAVTRQTRLAGTSRLNPVGRLLVRAPD